MSGFVEDVAIDDDVVDWLDDALDGLPDPPHAVSPRTGKQIPTSTAAAVITGRFTPSPFMLVR